MIRSLSIRIWLALLIAVLLPVPPPAAADPGTEVQAPRWRWDDARRVVAFGDVHGADDALFSLLRATALIDEAGDWVGGASHLVSLGDVVDRGAGSRAVLDLLMRLEGQARRVGGGVHMVLGNHEVMNLLGDLRYVAPGEFAAYAAEEDSAVRTRAMRRFIGRSVAGGKTKPQAVAEAELRFPPGYFGHRAAFSPSGRYGAWLLDRPALVAVGRNVFVHGGLPAVVAELGGAELNRRVAVELREYVDDIDTLTRAGRTGPEQDLLERHAMLSALLVETPPPPPKVRDAARRLQGLTESLSFGEHGPLWYRGTALHEESAERPLVEAALRALNADRAVLGHTVTGDRRIHARFEGRLLLADTGMQAAAYQGRPSAVIVEDGRVRAFYPDEGTFAEPIPGPAPSSVPSALAGAR